MESKLYLEADEKITQRNREKQNLGRHVSCDQNGPGEAYHAVAEATDKERQFHVQRSLVC